MGTSWEQGVTTLPGITIEEKNKESEAILENKRTGQKTLTLHEIERGAAIIMMTEMMVAYGTTTLRMTTGWLFSSSWYSTNSRVYMIWDQTDVRNKQLNLRNWQVKIMKVLNGYVQLMVKTNQLHYRRLKNSQVKMGAMLVSLQLLEMEHEITFKLRCNQTVRGIELKQRGKV